ncbi:MAG: hypothetical protein CSA65_00410 [Proteobacteria bacterium]|nr:MAG: hypothetical protein CSA65_00410 [Pseudomonadota bacterium]
MTRVYITIDTECREERHVGGRVQPVAGYDLRIWGRFANQRRDLGIRLLMDQLEANDLRATFYLDPIGSHSFGKAGLAPICEELRGRGHDVQLHLHPIQREADWISRGVEPPSDHIADYDLEGQAALLSEGLDLLIEAGVPRDELVSFRAGNFGASNDTWRAMAKVGLPLSSNYNPCYADKGMRIVYEGDAVNEQAPAGLFDTGVSHDGGCRVWELPISNFVEANGGHRHFQITAISLGEMKDVLLQAHALGIEEVTVVTHSFEIYHLDSAATRRGRLNRVNFYRLWGLCRFLRKHRDKFEVETVGELGRRLRDNPEAAAGRVISPPLPRGRRVTKLGRLLQQIYKRAEARLPL